MKHLIKLYILIFACILLPSSPALFAGNESDPPSPEQIAALAKVVSSVSKKADGSYDIHFKNGKRVNYNPKNKRMRFFNANNEEEYAARPLLMEPFVVTANNDEPVTITLDDITWLIGMPGFNFDFSCYGFNWRHKICQIGVVGFLQFSRRTAALASIFVA